MPKLATGVGEQEVWFAGTVMEKVGVDVFTAMGTVGCLIRVDTKRDVFTVNTLEMDMDNKWVLSQ